MGGSKLALVTGGSAGIGLEIARGLVAAGHRTVLAARSLERGEAAARDIAASTRAARPEVMEVDFSSLASIQAFAAAFLGRHEALDVLINNAGTWSSSRRVTRDGIELVWATNQLGYFLTTELLRPALISAPRARVVNVASELARDLDLTDVSFERRRYRGLSSYAQSKQANRMWTRALARRFAGTNVTANSLHPGGVATGLLGKGGGVIWKIVGHLLSIVSKTPKEGADTALWLATSDDVAGRTGLFYANRKERRCRFTDDVEEEKLWALCASMTGVKRG
jgi:NAD(P)-dependent dehydrogenase (short-subunit alcohol dehydrogenase family)